MKASPCFIKISSLSLLAIALMVVPQLSAAEWGGGVGDWVSDNWGLPNGGSPGDSANPREVAILSTDGTVVIKAGDTINLVNEGDLRSTLTVSEVNQTGGDFITTQRLSCQTNFTVSGGNFTSTDGELRVQAGGAFNFTGGTVEAGGIRFSGGVGSVNISGGQVHIQQIQMGNDANITGSVTITGSKISELESQNLGFANQGGSATSTVNFFFDADGVTSWKTTGGSGVSLGIGDHAANLSVDVSARPGDGKTGVELFSYIAKRTELSGTFGEVTITDATYGTLTLGTDGALKPGQYFLDYGELGNTNITLFYNTTR